MTLLNAIKAFVNPPDEADSEQPTDERQQAENTPTESEQSEPTNTLAVSDDDTTIESTDPAEPTETQTAPQPGGVTEGETSPYSFTPTGQKTISGYQLQETGHPFSSDGTVDTSIEETYMGSWPRSMVESKLKRPKDATWVGFIDDPTKRVDAAPIEYEWLFRHATIFGETGSGKSTLLTNMMTQWIFGGHGVCFIDPKGGGDANALVQRIPPHRIDDLIWIEPGSTRDRMIGFNLLETDSDPGDSDFEAEVQAVVEQFGEVIKNTSAGEGAVIDEVVDEVTRFLVKQEYNYNVLDLYAILFDEEDRQQLPQDVKDQFDQKALESIADKDDEDLNSIKRRVRPWVTDITTRDILNVRNSGINITKAIEDDKIIIVDVGRIQSEDVMQMFVTALVRRMWSAIQRREKSHSPDPFFLVCDEFKKVAIDRLGIGEIMSEARSYKFSITLATQQPSQLDKEVRQSVLNSSKHILTYKAGSEEDNRMLAKQIKGIDAEMLGNLPEYHIAGQMMSRGSPHSVVLQTFAPYPPLHTPQEAEAIIEKSLHRHGKQNDPKEWEEADLSEYGVRTTDQGEEEEEDLLEINKDHSVTLPEFLRLIFTAQSKYASRTFDGESGYIRKKDLEEFLKERYGKIGHGNIGKIIIEEIHEDVVKTKDDDDIYFKLTDEGEGIAFDQDSGEGGSSGSAKHRRVLATSWREFTRLGYDMEVPNQEDWGEDPPDGVATPPIQPVKESSNSAEFYQLESMLKSEYSRLYELFGDLTVAVEAETTTQTKPAQTIKNLSKAINRNQNCALVTRERIPDKDNSNTDGEQLEVNPYEDTTPVEALEKEARLIYNIIKNPPLVRKMDGQDRMFYNNSAGKKIELKDGSYALQKKTGSQTIWREDGNKVILDNGSEDETVTFRTAAEIMDRPSRRKFNYHYKRDNREGVIVVRDSKDNVINSYDNKAQMKKDGWKPVITPAIPESMFDFEDEDKVYPDDDSWQILIQPREANPEFDSDILYVYKPDEKNPHDRFEPLVSESRAEEEEKNAEDTVVMPNVGGDDEPDNQPDEEQEPNKTTEEQTDDKNEVQETPEETVEEPSEEEQPPSQPAAESNEDDAWADYRSDDASSQPTENKPTESKPTENKPTESKPTENKPTESKPTENKPTESKPTESSSEDEESTSNEEDETSDTSDTEENEETEDETDDADEPDEDADEVDDEVWGDYKSSSIEL